MTETNKIIRAKHAALTLLSGRTLPTLTSDLKIVRLLKSHYHGPHQITEDALDRLRKKLPEGWTANIFPPHLQVEWDRFMTDTQDVPDVPDTLRLTKDDMPQTLKTGLGDANRQGVADIIIALGDLFVDDPVAK